MNDAGGYGKPPSGKRWQKGQSGNPRGRIKGSRNLKTDFIAELREVVQVKEKGESKSISTQRALTKSLLHHAIQGHSAAIAQVLRLISLFEGVEEPPATTSTVDDQQLIADFLSRNTANKGEP